jgi:hypothetical protein
MTNSVYRGSRENLRDPRNLPSLKLHKNLASSMNMSYAPHFASKRLPIDQLEADQRSQRLPQLSHSPMPRYLSHMIGASK